MFKEKNVANNEDMSSLRAPRQNGLYTNKHLEKHQTRRTTRHNRYLE